MTYAKLAVTTVQAVIALWLLSAPPDVSLAGRQGQNASSRLARRVVAWAARSAQGRGSDRALAREQTVTLPTIAKDEAIVDDADDKDHRLFLSGLHASERAPFGLGVFMALPSFDRPDRPASADPRPVYRLCHRLTC